MKALLSTVAAMLVTSGCALSPALDLSIMCDVTGNSLVCGWTQKDGGTDAGSDVLDGGRDGGGTSGDAGSDGGDGGLDSAVADASSEAGTPRDAAVDASQPAANRPATSKGTGPFVVGNKLYDGNGKPLRLVGDTILHPDFWNAPRKTAPINAMRIQLYFDDPARNVADMKHTGLGGTIADKNIMVPSWWDATCSGDLSKFEAIVQRWVRGMVQFKTVERNMILNVANEASMSDADWQTKHIEAITRIRAAGWDGMILVDANGCGQNPDVIIQRGAAVLASDPQKNVGFSVHLYGNWWAPGHKPANWNPPFELETKMAALGATGLFVMIGEVGPGIGDGGFAVGPSPTTITARMFVDVAARYGVTSYLAWAGDDTDQAGGGCSGNWFCMANPVDSTNYNSWGREARALWMRDNPGKASTF